MDYTAEQINKAFDELPKTTNRAIHLVNVSGKITEVTEKYKLNQDISDVLNIYVTFVLIGLMQTEDFNSYITKILSQELEDSKKIIDDVHELIFTAVYEKRKELEEDNLLGETEEEIISGDEEISKLLIKITQKYKLQINQSGEIEKETERFLNGEILSSDYEKNILSITKLSEPDFSSLLKDLNEIILKKKEEKEDDSEVPIPPYRANRGEKENSVRDQEEISKEIEQIQSNNYREPIAEEDKIPESEHNIYKESGIEMLKEKLGGVKITEQKENDYSLPKIKNTGMEFETNSKQSLNHDLYREEI